MKKILIIIIVVLVIAFGFIYLSKNKEKLITVVGEQKTPIELCFYKEAKTSRGFYDIALLKMKLLGSTVTGEFRNLPAEKDSKIGTFEGKVSAVDKYMMARTADVWWNSMAEGMKVKEQLRIIFGEGNANVGFGEMMDRGDGVYIYKDVPMVDYSLSLTDVSCSDIDDRLIVEKYIRDNIKTITQEKAVLGGSWYVVNVHIDPNTKTGDVVYEDGHVQGKATFSYERIGDAVKISNVTKK